MKNAHVGNQPAAIAGILGMHYAFAQNVAYGSSGGYGTAVLSRFPIVSADNTHLPRPGNTQQRGLAHVVIDVDGKEVSIYNSHLQNLSESARIMQIRAIAGIVALGRPAADLRRRHERPLRLAGDGHRPDGVHRHLGHGRVGGGLTHPSSHLRGRIDYLMHANDGITPIASDVLPARLSDHMAVRARYVIEGPGGQRCTDAAARSTEKPRAADAALVALAHLLGDQPGDRLERRLVHVRERHVVRLDPGYVDRLEVGPVAHEAGAGLAQRRDRAARSARAPTAA